VLFSLRKHANTWVSANAIQPNREKVDRSPSQLRERAFGSWLYAYIELWSCGAQGPNYAQNVGSAASGNENEKECYGKTDPGSVPQHPWKS
jgi:hypothetical protein